MRRKISFFLEGDGQRLKKVVEEGGRDNLKRAYTNSFHGGLLGVLIAVFLYKRKFHKKFLDVTDFIAPLFPIGLFFGRIGNFINAELWGRPTDVPWAVLFPHVEGARHPSQLYEAILEG